jgi:hypothetical protein
MWAERGRTMSDYLREYDYPQSTGDGMTKLTPSLNPARYLLGIAFGVSLWNIIFIIKYKCQWCIYDRELAIIVFVLFIAVNAFLFIAFFYFLVFYYIRQPMLKISNSCPRLGEKVTLTWTLPYYRSIKSLVITLDRVESIEGIKCLYTSLTPYKKSVIASMKLVDTTEKRDIGSGNVEFKTPDSSMHSFSDSRCQIIWQLRLHTGKKWNDHRFEYIINVQPHEV